MLNCMSFFCAKRNFCQITHKLVHIFGERFQILHFKLQIILEICVDYLSLRGLFDIISYM